MNINWEEPVTREDLVRCFTVYTLAVTLLIFLFNRIFN
jgi:hypothetical protein